MKLSQGIGILAISSNLALTSCVLGRSGGTTTVTISPNPTTVPVNSTVTFTSHVTGNANNPTWILLGFAFADLGTPHTQIGGSKFVYKAPATPPVYSGNTLPAGVVDLQAQVGYGFAEVKFAITAPSVTVGIYPATADVALGSTHLFYGYAVGDANNQFTAQVNGVTGGLPATGTIALAGANYGNYTYTAPASMPITGNTVSITFISQADPTKSQSATVTLH